jgi:hypothetical protein
MILKKRQNWIRDISLHQPNKDMVLEGDITRDSCFKPEYTLGPAKKLFKHLFVCVLSWSDNGKINFGSWFTK